MCIDFIKLLRILTGRKVRIHLTPLLHHELAKFDGRNLTYRMRHGGLPPFFIGALPDLDYQEWLSSYWARDVQELYQLDKRHSFMKFTELVLAQSGSLFDATRFAAPCEVTRPTISSYLSVLETTFVVYVVRPFHSSARAEIVSAPKVYGFDTGFVCHARGWDTLRQDDLGGLWEHLVLNELNGQLQELNVFYWRDKRGHEIDFIALKKRNAKPIAIECKWNAAKFDSTNLKAFRRRYPEGENFVVSADIGKKYKRNYGDLLVTFTSLEGLIETLVEAF